MLLRDLLVNHLMHSGLHHRQAQSYAANVRSNTLVGLRKSVIAPGGGLVAADGDPEGHFEVTTHGLSPEELHLAVALAQIVDTAAYLNEQIRVWEQAEFAAALQRRILGGGASSAESSSNTLLIAPGRHLLRYGLLNLVSFYRSFMHLVLGLCLGGDGAIALSVRLSRRRPWS